MSGIIGYKNIDGSIIMGADSRAIYGEGYIHPAQVKKIIRKENMLIGVVGLLRANSIIELMDIEKKVKYDSDYKYILKVVEGIRTELTAKGVVSAGEGYDRTSSGFLIAYNAGIYLVCGTFAVVEVSGDFAVIGIPEYAYGVLEALEYEESWSPKERIAKALEITAKHTGTVAAPFIFETLDSGTATTTWYPSRIQALTQSHVVTTEPAPIIYDEDHC